MVGGGLLFLVYFVFFADYQGFYGYGKAAKLSPGWTNNFSAVEMKREDIAITIHDTIIQEVIYHKKQIESAGDVDKSEVLNTLDDVVFELRELCSNIYPLMIKELGLKNAILELLNKFQIGNNSFQCF